MGPLPRRLRHPGGPDAAEADPLVDPRHVLVLRGQEHGRRTGGERGPGQGARDRRGQALAPDRGQRGHTDHLHDVGFRILPAEKRDALAWPWDEAFDALPTWAARYLWRPRQSVQAVKYLCSRKRILTAGPWDETLFWLFGELALQSQVEARQPSSRRFDAGGYYTIAAVAIWNWALPDRDYDGFYDIRLRSA